jgi:Heat shock protein
MKKLIFTVSLLLFMGFTACKVSKQSGKAVNPETETVSDMANAKQTEIISDSIDVALCNKHWRLVELNGNPVQYKDGAEAHILFKTDGTISGNLGCNSFFGSYKVTKGVNRIKFSPLGATQRWCGEMATEDGFKNVLNTVDSYYVNDGKLVFNRARMAPLARFEEISAQ